MSGIVRAVHQSSSKLGDTPLVRLDLFESLPSRRFGCRASTTNSTTKSRSTSLYNAPASSRGGCRALHLYSSTALYTLHPLHPPSLSHDREPPSRLRTLRPRAAPLRPTARPSTRRQSCRMSARRRWRGRSNVSRDEHAGFSGRSPRREEARCLLGLAVLPCDDGSAFARGRG